MASLTIQRTYECAAQTHVTLTVTGDVSHVYHATLAEIIAPLEDHEKDTFIRALIKFAKIGRTTAQIRTALTNGVTVTI